MPYSHHRGHLIFNVLGSTNWFFVDTGQPVPENVNRPCGKCGKENTPEGHDACLGALPGVMNACCGHGDHKASYIMFEDGFTVRGFTRIEPCRTSDKKADNAPTTICCLQNL